MTPMGFKDLHSKSQYLRDRLYKMFCEMKLMIPVKIVVYDNNDNENNNNDNSNKENKY